ncbi:MAG: EVE domain-containing protein [Alphaproteobacteria bacterium]|nr:EVE domain-containing protein [Alphaproteobacteria bacterium]
MAYWLMKSEPNVFSWDDMVKVKKEGWDGVRNYQASNNMKAMKIGDMAFFYHSNIGKEVVGIVKISKLYHPDPTDTSGRFGMVEVSAHKPLKTAVTLADIKAHPKLQKMALVKQSRLSVCPVTADEWKTICKLGGVS